MKIKRCPFCGAVLEYREHVARAVPGQPLLRFYKHPVSECYLSNTEIGMDELAAWNTREPDVIRCRDCRKDGLLECPLVRIERQQLVFVDHDPDWFCGDGEVADDED